MNISPGESNNKFHEQGIVKYRTWFGLMAKADIQRGRWHRAGYGRLVIPHPPVVNLLLRRGLRNGNYHHLSSLHEIGHLQMLPLELLYAGIMLGLLYRHEHVALAEFIVVMLSCFSAWEMLAESFVMQQSMTQYRLSYSNVSYIPRILFWTISTLLLVWGWGIVLNIT